MLGSLFDRVRANDRRFTVYRSGETSDFEERFANHNIRLDSRSLPSDGPDPFLVIETDGKFLGAVGLRTVERLFEAPITRLGTREREGFAEGYRVLFELLDETVFAAMTRRQLLAVSREIEDRAYRVGTGTPRVSFQTFSTFESQLDVYRSLADDTNLDIHIYAAADWSPPPIAGITYHEVGDETVERYWALAFDGGLEETHPCGLLARERSDGYCGFWTDDPALVAELSDELASA